MAAIGEDVGKELVIERDVACEMEMREVAEGHAVGGEDPVGVVDADDTQEVTVLGEEGLDLIGCSTCCAVREVSEMFELELKIRGTIR